VKGCKWSVEPAEYMNASASSGTVSPAAADAIFMGRALELAARGVALTSPNPMVGAVLVRKGKIVGEGFHVYDGVRHAEIVALEEAGDAARGATLYINLEPCCHKGRTGPCTNALILADVKRVVVAMKDPNPAVGGRGFKHPARGGDRSQHRVARSGSAPPCRIICKMDRQPATAGDAQIRAYARWPACPALCARACSAAVAGAACACSPPFRRPLDFLAPVARRSAAHASRLRRAAHRHWHSAR